MKTLRFELRVLNEDEEVMVSDFTTFPAGAIDQFGTCEQVDIHVGAALRAARRDLEKAQ